MASFEIRGPLSKTVDQSGKMRDTEEVKRVPVPPPTPTEEEGAKAREGRVLYSGVLNTGQED